MSQLDASVTPKGDVSNYKSRHAITDPTLHATLREAERRVNRGENANGRSAQALPRAEECARPEAVAHPLDAYCFFRGFVLKL